jgi:FMN phosphatase YigB (HAD superfamily)
MVSAFEPPTLVCFDVGGVLVRLCAGWEEAYREAGLDLRPIPAGPAVEARRREVGIRLDMGELSLDTWAESVAQVIDLVYSADELKRVHHAFLKGEYAGAVELVDELNASGVTTACLSNTNAAHWLRLAHVDQGGLRPGVPEFPSVARLKHPLASHLLRAVKPDPAAYAQLEEATGRRGSAIVFFDDREENVIAARRHGWRAERVDPLADTIAKVRQHLATAGVLCAADASGARA